MNLPADAREGKTARRIGRGKIKNVAGYIRKFCGDLMELSRGLHQLFCFTRI